MIKQIIDWLNKPVPSYLKGFEVPIGLTIGTIIGFLLLWIIL